ncbi:hypothetical protein M3Y97_00714400 [Aphelenchoides bicaudatus]|nr:hypothetical protein M3Y97_00714400 [Aphelenchoides bicaudatus]
MLKLLSFILLLAFPNGLAAKHPTHAVIVSAASSSDEICGSNLSMDIEAARVYHSLINGGVPAENIIVFMLGVIMNKSGCNPWPGHLYKDGNKGIDYFPTLKVDYQAESMTTENFLAVLRGDENGVKGGSGRVLKTNKEDRIFIFHDGHGDVGLLKFADSEDLTKEMLNKTLDVMIKNEKFKELVYFVSTCHSGSMFEGILPKNGPIYAITSTTPSEGEPFVNCKIIKDVDIDPTKQTLKEQYQFIKNNSKENHPTEYGNPVSNFEGSAQYLSAALNVPVNEDESSVPKCSIGRYESLKQKVKKFGFDEKLNAKLTEMEQERGQIQKMIKQVVSSIIGRSKQFVDAFVKEQPKTIMNLNCHHRVIKLIEKECQKINKSPFVNEFVGPMINLCESEYKTEHILSSIRKECTNFKLN